MENTMLFIKYAILFVLELTVVLTVAAVLISGIYQLVRDSLRPVKVQETVPETKTIS